jgi:hypothetical protein
MHRVYLVMLLTQSFRTKPFSGAVRKARARDQPSGVAIQVANAHRKYTRRLYSEP